MTRPRTRHTEDDRTGPADPTADTPTLRATPSDPATPAGARTGTPAATPAPRRRGPLTPVELATCGILSGLAVVLGVLGAVLPVFGSAAQILATIPVAMIAVRLRARAGVAAFATTVLTALAIGGVQSAVSVLQAALVGVLVGILHRRGTSRAGVALAGTGLGAAIGLVSVLVLWLLTDLRELVLESLRVSTTGYLELLGRWSLLTDASQQAVHLLEEFLRWWWVWIPISTLLGVLVTALIAHWLIGAVLSRLQLGSAWDPLLPTPTGPAPHTDARSGRTARGGSTDPALVDPTPPPDPLPTRLRDVHFRYPGAGDDALRGVDLDVAAGEFVVVAGPNGSGKSTLALVLAGAEPSAGTVVRPGAVGLGHEGGTALLAQRSELQMLGETVAEDVVWGMDEGERRGVDVSELLSLVGLSGTENTPPRNLSGGQLQRLALAGALARGPRLLVSDESTAMVDAAGRRDLVALLAALPGRGTTVVHITHDPTEARSADRLVRMEAGRIVFDGPPASDPLGWARADGQVAGDHIASAGHGVPGPAVPASTVSTPGTPVRTPGAPPSSMSSPAPSAPSPTSPDGPPPEWTPEPWQKVERLWADRVTHVYDVGTPWEAPVLHDVSLILSQGEGVLVTGDNGSGKTTLSRILAGLMAPTWGRCTLDGTPMQVKVGEVALAMQHARLQLQRPSVRSDILSAARAPRRTDRAEGDRLVAAALAEVGLDGGLATRGIDELSGGQMRRVALAGLLASDPKVIVLDEPLAGLDPDSRRLVVAALEARRRRGLGVLVISHDVEGLGALCQRHLHLDQGVLS